MRRAAYLTSRWPKNLLNQGGTWVAFKQFGRWQRPVWLSINPLDLARYRLIVSEAFAHWAANRGPNDRLGFAPRTFAVWALEKAQRTLNRHCDDDLKLSFAMYQTIKAYAGNQISGPIGNGTRLPAIYTDGRETK